MRLDGTKSDKYWVLIGKANPASEIVYQYLWISAQVIIMSKQSLDDSLFKWSEVTIFKASGRSGVVSSISNVTS